MGATYLYKGWPPTCRPVGPPQKSTAASQFRTLQPLSGWPEHAKHMLTAARCLVKWAFRSLGFGFWLENVSLSPVWSLKDGLLSRSYMGRPSRSK